MKKGEIYEGIVEKVGFPNKGVVSLENGEQVTVKHVIPGQKVSVSIQKVRKGKGEGRLLAVLESSPLELEEDVCRYFGSCGGCTYLTMKPQEQLLLKQQQVKELLAPVLASWGTLWEDVFEGIRKSPRRYAYRNKMEFSFGDEIKDGPLSLGLHKRGSFHDILTVDGCRIVDEDYSKILVSTADYFRTRDISYFHKMRHEGYLRYLLVRKAVKTGEILVDLVTSSQMEADTEKPLLQGMAEKLLSLQLEGKIAGILHTRNDSLSDAIIDQGTRILYGKDYFYEELLGLKFKISPFSFFQTNSLGAEVLYTAAREFVAESGNGKIVYDLYSGTGTIAQMLAPVAKKVIGVEIVAEAVEAARENAAENGLSNCEFIAGDVLKVLDEIEEKPEFIVLDPPRDGIHPKVLDMLGKHYEVEKMVYISCKPTSLARDLAKLQEYGYRVERVCCVDMFPGTTHTECVVGIQRKHI